MPDSFGKRQRDQVKARKAAERDERRIARNQRRRTGPVVDTPRLARLEDIPEDPRGGAGELDEEAGGSSHRESEGSRSGGTAAG